jgi:hypothetical protein
LAKDGVGLKKVDGSQLVWLEKENQEHEDGADHQGCKHTSQDGKSG